MILGLRTDKPEAELYLIKENEVEASYTWEAHRQLSDTLLVKIEALLEKEDITLQDLTAIVVFAGPGSFTGLRIGISVANTLAYSLQLPIASGTGEDWQKQALEGLSGQNGPQVIVPEYGAEAHITLPRK